MFVQMLPFAGEFVQYKKLSVNGLTTVCSMIETIYAKRLRIAWSFTFYFLSLSDNSALFFSVTPFAEAEYLTIVAWRPTNFERI